jgi:hypothetical protein
MAYLLANLPMQRHGRGGIEDEAKRSGVAGWTRHNWFSVDLPNWLFSMDLNAAMVRPAIALELLS